MLNDEDKRWFAAQICGTQDSVGASIACYEQRIGARLERFQTTLLAEFQRWALPISNDERSHSDALRTTDLELEALQGRVEKLEGK
jgi:hypothetical protein